MSIHSIHDHPLNAFLRERKVDGRTGTWTLTKMSKDGGGKWNIEDKDYPQFLDLLNDYLFVKDYRAQNLVEQRRTDGFSPLLIDLDFQYSPQHAMKRRFEDKNIKAFIRSYIDTIKDVYDLSGAPAQDLRFFVCLRNSPYEKKGGSTRILKDGVHIECPDLCLNSEAQQIIRVAMLEKEAVKHAFDKTEYTNADTDVYDESVIKKNGWFFYGESKPDIPPYKLSAVWTWCNETDSLLKKGPTGYNNRQLLELLSIRHRVEPVALAVREGVQEQFDHYKSLLVVKQAPAAVAPAPEVEQTPAQRQVIEELNAAIDKSYSESEIAMARRFVMECLNDTRADGFQSWLEVGWCIHTIDPTEDGFNLWMDFSKKSPKFSANDIRDLQYKWATNWGKLPGVNALKMGTLRMWAKQDNPEKYKEIVDGDIIDFILRTVRGGHYDVAKVMHRLYSERYTAYVEKRNIEWFEFRNNTWANIPQAFSIRSQLSEEFTDYIWEAYRLKRRQLEDKSMTDGGREINNEQTKLLLKVIDKLGQTEYKSSIIKEAASLFHDKDFIANLDGNPTLVGTATAVLNIRTETGDPAQPHKVTWRPGKASDYVSFQMGNYPNERLKPIHYIPYDPVAAATDPIYREIDDFMEKVFPRADLRAYMWRLMAAHLEGANVEQLFFIWTGRGGNGKSVLDKIMRYTFGDYAFTLPSTVLTRKSGDSGAANPEIIGMRNRRYISMSEPETSSNGGGAPLNAPLMKKYTGNDVIEARGLFQEQQYFKIAGRIHLLCNEKPAVNSNDGGTWRRIRVIPFEALFKDADDPEWKNPDIKHIHLKDYTLEDRIKKWPQALFSRLVWIYENEYLKNGLNPEPPIVKEASEEYRAKSDHFAAFKNARMRVGGTNMDVLKSSHPLADIHKKYMTWHAEYASGMPKLSMNELGNRLEEFLGKPKGIKKIFERIKVFGSDQEVDEFDAEGAAVAAPETAC